MICSLAHSTAHWWTFSTESPSLSRTVRREFILNRISSMIIVNDDIVNIQPEPKPIPVEEPVEIEAGQKYRTSKAVSTQYRCCNPQRNT